MSNPKLYRGYHPEAECSIGSRTSGWRSAASAKVHLIPQCCLTKDTFSNFNVGDVFTIQRIQSVTNMMTKFSCGEMNILMEGKDRISYYIITLVLAIKINSCRTHIFLCSTSTAETWLQALSFPAPIISKIHQPTFLFAIIFHLCLLINNWTWVIMNIFWVHQGRTNARPLPLKVTRPTTARLSQFSSALARCLLSYHPVRQVW